MNPIIPFFTKNLPYKVTALMLSILFWYLVQGEEVLEINRKIQVNINTPEGYMIRGGTVRFKDATLTGPRAVLGDFSSRPIEANINLPKGKTGKFRYRIDKDFIYNWDNRIRLTVHDAYMNIFVDEKYTRTFPIKEYLQGVPADDFIIEKTIIEPNKVTVTGLKSDLNRIKQILTEPIDVSDLKKSSTFDVGLQLRDLFVNDISIDRVQVNVQLGEKKINKRFTSIPVELEGGNLKASVKPRFVSIVVQGTPGILNFINRENLRAFVDIRDLGPGKYDKKIQVKIPTDTILIETFPETAAVEIYKEGHVN